MGIFINLKIIPQRIKADEWERVYQESLQLVSAYDFMDEIEAERNGLRYSYARKTRDRENLFGKGFHGWHSIGDMRTGANTEDFVLYGDLKAYLPGKQMEDNGADILLEGLGGMEGISRPGGCINIWGNKTQGEDSHIYLLAIACLIADRFPDAAMVSGDISAGQCRKAVEWANQYLDKPVDMPCTGCRERLIRRLRQAHIPADRLLESFYILTEEAKDAGLGEFLRREFCVREISEYYRKCFLQYKIYQRGFYLYMKEYLEMGYDFKELCRIVVADSHGMQAAPVEFLSKIIESKLHIEWKETFDFTRVSTEKADSGDVDNLLKTAAKVIGKYCGAGNKNVNAFYPLERILEDCQEVFGSRCDVAAVVERLLKDGQGKGNTAILQSVLYDAADSVYSQEVRRKKEKVREEEKYDIHSYRELINFVPGCRVRPQLEEDLLKNFQAIYQFVQEEFGEFQALGREQRENYFISNNRYVLLHENVWDIIFSRIMDDTYIKRIYGLFNINCSQKDGYTFCKNIFDSMPALDYYWEKAEKMQR